MKKNARFLTAIVLLMANTQAIGMAPLGRTVTSRFRTFAGKQLTSRLNKPSVRRFGPRKPKTPEVTQKLPVSPQTKFFQMRKSFSNMFQATKTAARNARRSTANTVKMTATTTAQAGKNATTATESAAKTVALAPFRGTKKAYEATKRFGQRLTIKTAIAAGLVGGGYYAKTKDHNVQDAAKDDLTQIYLQQQEIRDEQRKLDENAKSLSKRQIKVQQESLDQTKAELDAQMAKLYKTHATRLIDEDGSIQIIPTRPAYSTTADSNLIAQGIFPIQVGDGQTQYMQTTPHPWTTKQMKALSETVGGQLPTAENMKRRTQTLCGLGKKQWESWQAGRRFKLREKMHKQHQEEMSQREKEHKKETSELKGQHLEEMKKREKQSETTPKDQQPTSCSKWHLWPF